MLSRKVSLQGIDLSSPQTSIDAVVSAVEVEEQGRVPKVMLVNTSAEYWRGDAALIHTDLATMTDAPESEHVRRYHLAGTLHGAGAYPPLNVRPSDGIRRRDGRRLRLAALSSGQNQVNVPVSLTNSHSEPPGEGRR